MGRIASPIAFYLPAASIRPSCRRPEGDCLTVQLPLHSSARQNRAGQRTNPGARLPQTVLRCFNTNGGSYPAVWVRSRTPVEESRYRCNLFAVSPFCWRSHCRPCQPHSHKAQALLHPAPRRTKASLEIRPAPVSNPPRNPRDKLTSRHASGSAANSAAPQPSTTPTTTSGSPMPTWAIYASSPARRYSASPSTRGRRA